MTDGATGGAAAVPLRIGTRGSTLARTQSGLIADALTAATGIATELVVYCCGSFSYSAFLIGYCYNFPHSNVSLPWAGV